MQIRFYSGNAQMFYLGQINYYEQKCIFFKHTIRSELESFVFFMHFGTLFFCEDVIE